MQTFQLPAASPRRQALAFAPDGRFLIVGFWSGSFALVDTTGRQRITANRLDPSTWGYAPVGDGRAAYVRPPHTVGVWQWGTNRRVATRDLEGAEPRALAGAPDRRTIYLGVRPAGAPGRTEIWALDVADLARRAVFGPHRGEVERLVVSTDGGRLAGYTGMELRVWDVSAGPPRRAAAVVRLREHVGGLALSADGTRLVATGNHGVTVWNAATGDEEFRSGKHRRAVECVACAPTRPVFATGDAIGHVFLWDYTGRVLTRFDWGLREVFGLAFAPDGLRCAAVDANGTIVVWDVDA